MPFQRIMNILLCYCPEIRQQLLSSLCCGFKTNSQWRLLKCPIIDFLPLFAENKENSTSVILPPNHLTQAKILLQIISKTLLWRSPYGFPLLE